MSSIDGRVLWSPWWADRGQPNTGPPNLSLGKQLLRRSRTKRAMRRDTSSPSRILFLLSSAVLWSPRSAGVSAFMGQQQQNGAGGNGNNAPIVPNNPQQSQGIAYMPDKDTSNIFAQNQQWKHSKLAQDPFFFNKLGSVHKPKYMWIGTGPRRCDGASWVVKEA